jgi:molybdopterin-guanine dinucleotide biosynthesis protein
MSKPDDDLMELLTRFAQEQVDYVLVGGHAVSRRCIEAHCPAANF